MTHTMDIPKAKEVEIIVDEDKNKVCIYVDRGKFSLTIDSINKFSLRWVPVKVYTNANDNTADVSSGLNGQNS